MIRSLAIFSVAAILLSAFSIPIMALNPGKTIVGGHHHLSPGETLQEDVSFYFAQVTIDEDTAVDGHIYLYSSTLDLRGNVTEDIHAFESDLTVRESARVDGQIDDKDFIHWTMLLPAIAQLP